MQDAVNPVARNWMFLELGRRLTSKRLYDSAGSISFKRVSRPGLEPGTL